MDPQVPDSLAKPGPALQDSPRVRDGHWVAILSMALFVLVALGLTGFLYYQNQQLKSMLANYQTQVSPTPTATSDPTANWKTYTNTEYGYSIKYPTDYFAIETSSDYVRISLGINDPNLPQSQTYLSIQLDKSPKQLPEAIYKKTADGKTLRISQILMDVDENQKPQIKAIFDQILSTFKFTGAGSPTPTSKACTQEAKLCPDGSYVGRTGPNCEFAPCPTPK